MFLKLKSELEILLESAVGLTTGVFPKKTSFKHHTKYQYEIEMDQEMKDKIYDLYAYDFIKLNYEK